MADRPVMPNNPLARSLDAITGGRRSTVLPPSPPLEPKDEDQLRREYEKTWGPEEQEASQATEPVHPSPGEQSPSGPRPLTDFWAIDLIRLLVIGDNGETFPIPEQNREQLMRFCMGCAVEHMNRQFATLQKNLGLSEESQPDAQTETVPEVREEAVPKQVRSRTRKAP